MVLASVNNRDHREGWDRRRDNRDDFRGKRPRDNDHEVNTVKHSNGRRDYLEDYNKTLKGPCQLHLKSNHTMEECRILKNIYTQLAAQGDAAKTTRKHDRRNQEDETCWYLVTHKETIRKRTDIGEHFTREVIQSYRIYIFTTGRKGASD